MIEIKNNLDKFPRKGSYYCNYCHLHKKWLEDSEKELEELLEISYDEWFEKTELGHDAFVGFNMAIRAMLGVKL